MAKKTAEKKKEKIDLTQNVIVLDVEGTSTARPYNIGYIVADLQGNVISKRSYALPECIWENLTSCMQCEEMTHKNIQDILADFGKPKELRKYTYITIENFKKILYHDIAVYNIREIWAYNCPFDKGSLNRLLGSEFIILDNFVAFYDILPAITTTKLMSKSYVKYCQKNGYVTEKGNIMSKAEIVYRYLTGNNNFVEEHTGLADVQIEYQILLTAINSHKNFDKADNSQSWKMIKKFCEDNSIEVKPNIPPIEQEAQRLIEDTK